jgi:hypothetical protein
MRKKMGLLRTHSKKVVLANSDYKDKYWPILSNLVFEKFGTSQINEPNAVQETLNECFSTLCKIFEEKLSDEKRASFYIFCHNLHEDSIDLFQLQLQKIPLNINEEDFASSRRVLKIILEQSTKLDLVGTPNFFYEMKENLENYVNLLEELLYIGSWCLVISENTARSQLFDTSTGIQVIDDELNILTHQPYPELFKYIFYDMPRHNSKVALSDSMIEFKTIVENNYGVKYDDLASFINQQLESPIYRLGLTKIEPLKNEILKELKCDKNFINDFYAGLTVNKDNCLTIEKCFFNNQSEFRFTYRPILELIVDSQIYNLIGYNKWLESMSLLSTNAFPFGLYPTEWTRHQKIKEFVQKTDNTHDKILEDPIVYILNEKSFFNDSNVESFEQPNGQNINIKNTVGDIDIIFIDVEFKLIYVCECKHNRSRHDMNNWRRDYSNFKDKYESQLERKIDWVKGNKDIVETHFKHLYPDDFKANLNDYDIRGIFIINAPTIYMYNGKYRAMTITDINDLLNRKYTDLKFEFTNENSGEKTLIEYPYFDNVKQLMG